MASKNAPTPSQDQPLNEPIPPCRFTSEWLKEEKTFDWKIADFDFKNAKKNASTFEFRAGETINQPSTWNLNFKLKDKTSNSLQFYLKLKDCTGSRNKVYAELKTSIIGPVDEPERTTAFPFGLQQYSKLTVYSSKNSILLETAESLAGEDDTLHVQVTMVIYGDEMVNTALPLVSTQEMLNRTAVDEITKQFSRLLKTGLNSDFTIQVHKSLNSHVYVVKVHKSILSARSPVFEVMLSSQMLEKESGIVTIEDLTPRGLDVLLQYIYTGLLHDDWKRVPEQIVNAAEKYNIPRLKNYLDKNLSTICNAENSRALFKLAEIHGLTTASTEIVDLIKLNAESVINGKSRRGEQWKRPETAKSTSDSSSNPKEVKMITWKIKDLPRLYHQMLAKIRTCNIRIVTFTAGQSIGIPSTWRLKLAFELNIIKISFNLVKNRKITRSVLDSAQIHVAIKDSAHPENNTVTKVLTGVWQPSDSFGSKGSVEIEPKRSSWKKPSFTIQFKMVITGCKSLLGRIETIALQRQSLDNEIIQQLGGLLESGLNSDFVIRVKDEEENYVNKKVHKTILSARSAVFGAMMDQEPSGILTLDDLSLKSLNVLLKFAYTGQFCNQDWTNVPPVEIVNAAQTYGFPLIKKYCDQWLHSACTTENAFSLLSLANDHGLKEASKSISHFIKFNIEDVLGYD